VLELCDLFSLKALLSRKVPKTKRDEKRTSYLKKNSNDSNARYARVVYKFESSRRKKLISLRFSNL
jgi:hypothetical protein